MRLTYRMLDDRRVKGNYPVLIKREEARFWNEERGQAIFQTVNQFSNMKRSKETLISLDYCFVDIDSATKAEQLDKIKKGFVPSLLVESKNGFHVYFKLGEAIDLTLYQKIQKSLCLFYKGDPRATDSSRILRSPGFYHYKDPTNPFLVKTVLTTDHSYQPSELLYFYINEGLSFKGGSIRYQEIFVNRQEMRNTFEYSFWQHLWTLDCKISLEALSGSVCVNYEVYSFKKLTNGNQNIFVNGQSTSCWIDKFGRIGSMSDGGPTIYHWLVWFGHSTSKAIQIIKEVFKI